MDLRRLRYFVAVAEELHFGRAAERMCVVQSAISQQIRLLEEELGFALLERTRQRVSLTVPGEVFLPEARAILRRAQQGVDRVRASAGGAIGRLTIGFVDNVLWEVLPRILRAFRSQHPDVALKLSPLDRVSQIEALRASSIDICIVPAPPPSPSSMIAKDLLIGAPLVAALPNRHPLTERVQLSLSELTGETFVLFPPTMGSRLYEIIIGGCSAAGFMPRVAQEAEQLHTLLALVDAGLGVTLVPDWVAKTYSAGVSYVPITDDLQPYELLLAWRADSTNPSIDQFCSIASFEAKRLSDKA